jgi:hypothetical protein
MGNGFEAPTIAGQSPRSEGLSARSAELTSATLSKGGRRGAFIGCRIGLPKSLGSGSLGPLQFCPREGILRRTSNSVSEARQ